MSQLVRLEGKHSTQNAHCALVAEDVHAVRQEKAESGGRTPATPLQQLWQLG